MSLRRASLSLAASKSPMPAPSRPRVPARRPSSGKRSSVVIIASSFWRCTRSLANSLANAVPAEQGWRATDDPAVLRLGHALVDDLVDSRFDEGARDALPAAPAFAVVRQRVRVVHQIPMKFANQLAQQQPRKHGLAVAQRQPQRFDRRACSKLDRADRINRIGQTMLVAEVQREMDLQGKLRHCGAAQPIRSQPDPTSDPHQIERSLFNTFSSDDLSARAAPAVPRTKPSLGCEVAARRIVESLIGRTGDLSATSRCLTQGIRLIRVQCGRESADATGKWNRLGRR
jgi:hypothetical protein